MKTQLLLSLMALTLAACERPESTLVDIEGDGNTVTAMMSAKEAMVYSLPNGTYPEPEQFRKDLHELLNDRPSHMTVQMLISPDDLQELILAETVMEVWHRGTEFETGCTPVAKEDAIASVASALWNEADDRPLREAATAKYREFYCSDYAAVY